MANPSGARLLSDLGDRTKYIGGSDVAAILGRHPYQSPLEVWREKTGREVRDYAGEVAEGGSRVEPVILDWYEDRTGREIIERQVEYTSIYDERLVGHLDGLSQNGKKDVRVVEAKSLTPYLWSELGPEGTDEVPEYYITQVQWYMHISGYRRTDIAVLIDRRLRVYHVDYDRELATALVRAALDFWANHIETDEPPDPDGSEYYKRWLDERADKLGEFEIQAGPELNALAAERFSLHQTIKDLTAQREVVDQKIKSRVLDSIGDEEAPEGDKFKARIMTDHGKISWYKVRGRTRWKDVARAIDEEAADNLRDQHRSSSYTTLRGWPDSQEG